MPRIAALQMLRSTVKTVSAPAISSFRGSIPHPTQRFGVTAASRNTRFQAARYGLTWVGLAPTDRASFAAFGALRLMTNSYFTLHPATILIASAFNHFGPTAIANLVVQCRARCDLALCGGFAISTRNAAGGLAFCRFARSWAPTQSDAQDSRCATVPGLIANSVAE